MPEPGETGPFTGTDPEGRVSTQDGMRDVTAAEFQAQVDANHGRSDVMKWSDMRAGLGLEPQGTEKVATDPETRPFSGSDPGWKGTEIR